MKDPFAVFPSFVEINSKVTDAKRVIENVLSAYRQDVLSINEMNGVSLTLGNWRFDLRLFDTEPLVCLNIESCGRSDNLAAHVADSAVLLGGVGI